MALLGAGHTAPAPLSGSPGESPEGVKIADSGNLSNRKRLRPCTLEAELLREAFRVIHRPPDHAGSPACVPVAEGEPGRSARGNARTPCH